MHTEALSSEDRAAIDQAVQEPDMGPYTCDELVTLVEAVPSYVERYSGSSEEEEEHGDESAYSVQ